MNNIYRFQFDGKPGMVRVMADGSKQIAWAGMSFQFEAAKFALALAINKAIAAG